MNSKLLYEQLILEALRPLDIAYKQHFTQQQAQLYLDVLTGFHVDPQKLRLAVIFLITSNKFLPSMAEILETIRMLDRESSLNSYEAWNHVLYAASSIGFDKGLSVLTPLEAHAAESVGWYDICYGPISDTSLRRAHFLKAFQTFIDREHHNSQEEALLQASKQVNQKLNSKIEELTSAKKF